MTADTVGGVWNYAINLIRHWQHRGITVTLITMGAPLSQAQRRVVNTLHNLDLRETEYKLEWMDNPWEEVQDAAWLIKSVVQETEADLLHLNGFAHGAVNVSIPKVVVAHSCIYSWWKSVKGGSPSPQYSDYLLNVKKGILMTDHLVAPSKTMLDEINKIYGKALDQSVIPNGIQLSNYFSAQKEDLVLSVGRVWDEAKNIKALEPVAASCTWPFMVAGHVVHPQGCSAASVAHLQLLGCLKEEELQKLYAKAAIYAHPALYEPFGLATLEAAASGCALVLGDIPSLRENWDGAALFVNSNDPDCMTTVIKDLISNPQLRHEWSQKALRRAATFSIEKCANAYVSLYHQLIDIHAYKITNIKHENQIVLS